MDSSNPWVWDKEKQQWCYYDPSQQALTYGNTGEKVRSPGRSHWAYDPKVKDYYYYNDADCSWVYLNGIIIKVPQDSYVASPSSYVNTVGPIGTVEEIEEDDDEESEDDEDNVEDESVSALGKGMDLMSLGTSGGYQSPGQYQTGQGYWPQPQYGYDVAQTPYQSAPYGYPSSSNPYSAYGYPTMGQGQLTPQEYLNWIAQAISHIQQSYYDLIPAVVQGRREITLNESIKLFTKIVQIRYHGKSITGVARLDTAADYNFINLKWARKMGIDKHGRRIEDAPKMVLADGSASRPRRKALFRWQLKGGEHQWRSDFFLMGMFRSIWY
jgi:hypothetical protein